MIAWGEPSPPQSPLGSLPEAGLNVETRYLSFCLDETPDHYVFMHVE